MGNKCHAVGGVQLIWGEESPYNAPEHGDTHVILHTVYYIVHLADTSRPGGETGALRNPYAAGQAGPVHSCRLKDKMDAIIKAGK